MSEGQVIKTPISRISWGALLFLCGLGLYAVFGSPTPDHYGWVEYAVGGCLLAAIRFPDFKRDSVLLAVASAGVFLPALVGAMSGAVFADMVRDVIPFLFLFLVVLYRSHVEELGGHLVRFVAAMGIVFSVRALVPVWESGAFSNIASLGAPPDLLYLANSPMVLFSALWLMGTGFFLLFYKKQVASGLVLAALSVLPLLAMVMMMQRAGTAVYFVALLVFMGGLLARSPARFLVAFSVMAVVAAFFGPLLMAVAEALIWKTHLVGLNSRAQEWTVVLDLVSRDWFHALFGYGWGARIENPAVGGVSVLYTHSLLSSLLLKTGWVGAFVILSGVGFYVVRAVSTIFQNRILFVALLFPLLIAGGIYASYKSLGFGVILLIFLGYRYQKLELDRQVVS